MAGADLPAVQRIMRHTDPRITTEFYAHLSPGYLRSAIDRLAINPSTPDELPVAASASASAPTKRAREAAEPPEFAAPLLQPFDNGDLRAHGDSEKSPVFADLSGSGISGSNRRHSGFDNFMGNCDMHMFKMYGQTVYAVNAILGATPAPAGTEGTPTIGQ